MVQFVVHHCFSSHFPETPVINEIADCLNSTSVSPFISPYHLFEPILQPLQCTTSLCTLLFFFCVSHSCDCWQYSGYIYPLLLPYTAELAKHCPFLKTPSRQAEHKFSPPKGQNSIGLKHFWRLLSRPAVQKKCFMSLNTGNDFARRYIY